MCGKCAHTALVCKQYLLAIFQSTLMKRSIVLLARTSSLIAFENGTHTHQYTGAPPDSLRVTPSSTHLELILSKPLTSCIWIKKISWAGDMVQSVGYLSFTKLPIFTFWAQSQDLTLSTTGYDTTQNKNKYLGAGGIAQWWNICLVYVRFCL